MLDFLKQKKYIALGKFYRLTKIYHQKEKRV